MCESESVFLVKITYVCIDLMDPIFFSTNESESIVYHLLVKVSDSSVEF